MEIKVEGCEFYSITDGLCNCSSMNTDVNKHWYCKDNCFCYYKQLNLFQQDLKDTQEENNRLRNLLGKPYKRRIDLENAKLLSEKQILVEALEKTKVMFMEQGHCPWFDINDDIDCENCNDNCMLPLITQAIAKLRKE